jgi:hypothetical protein
MSRLSVTFLTPEGDKTTLQVQEGDSLLDIAHEHDIDLEGSLPCPSLSPFNNDLFRHDLT